jgi:hypothetical protein
MSYDTLPLTFAGGVGSLAAMVCYWLHKSHVTLLFPVAGGRGRLAGVSSTGLVNLLLTVAGGNGPLAGRARY